jgi:hypothetical protein
MDPVARVEGFIDIRTSAQVASFNANGSLTAPGFVVRVLQHFEQLAV